MNIKATIKTPEMTLTVIHKGRMNYSVQVDGIGEIGGRGNLSEAVALANRTAALGLQELETRIANAPNNSI
jgi:hypothetical protein